MIIRVGKISDPKMLNLLNVSTICDNVSVGQQCAVDVKESLGENNLQIVAKQ